MYRVAVFLHRIELTADRLQSDHPVHLGPKEVTAIIKYDVAAIRGILGITPPSDNPGITPEEGATTTGDDIPF